MKFEEGSSSGPATGHVFLRIGTIVAVVVFLAAIIACFSLARSFEVGRLSVPPAYDDVSYFQSAASWLALAPTRSVTSSIYGLLDQHAPFTILVSAVGLAWIPKGYAGPYILNAFVIAAFLLGIARLLKHSSLVNVVTCMVAVASIPMLAQTVAEGRPDLPWGLAIGLAVGGIVSRPILLRRLTSVFGLGLLCGLAVSIKPTAFAPSVALIGFAVGAELLRECIEAGLRRPTAIAYRGAPAAAVFTLGLLAAAAAMMSIRFQAIIAYIVSNFSTNLDFWATSETTSDALLHYSTGFDGRLALGGWLWWGLALFVMRFGIELYRRRSTRATTVLLAVVIVSYAIPTASPVKSYFLGAMFYGTFIVVLSLNLAAVLDSMSSRGAVPGSTMTSLPRPAVKLASLAPLIAASIVFAVAFLRGPVSLATTFEKSMQHDMRLATDRVWSFLEEEVSRSGSQSGVKPDRNLVVSFTSPYPVSADVIRLYAARAGMKIRAQPAYFNRTADEVLRSVRTSGYVVLSSSMPHNLPVPRMGDELIRRMDSDPTACLADSIPLQGIRTLRIYRIDASACEATR
ncbi:MAG: hypothetical protein PS018_21215 [bacterium]|nr:hypothetical protein [bacterium]